MKPIFAYVLAFRFPSQKAHTVYVSQTCEAARKLGYHSVLVAPAYRGLPATNRQFWQQFSITTPVTMVRLLGFDPGQKGAIQTLLTKRFVYQTATLFFSLQAVVWLLIRRPQVVQTGNPEVAIVLNLFRSLYRPQLILDFHIGPPQWLSPQVISSTQLVLLNTQAFKNQLLKQGFLEPSLLVMPNGVDVDAYQEVNTTQLAQQLELPTQAFVVSYVGRFETLRQEKGVFQMIKALSQLIEHYPSKPIVGLIVGGPERYLTEYQAYAQKQGVPLKQLLFVSQVPPNRVPGYIAVSSVGWLVYPKVPHFETKMSPMKVLEYFAAGKPMICSNFPSLQQMVEEPLVSFVSPKNTTEQTAALEKYLKHRDSYAQKRMVYAQKWSWKNRQSLFHPPKLTSVLDTLQWLKFDF